MNIIFIKPSFANQSGDTFDSLEFNSFGIKRICYHPKDSQEMQVMELQCRSFFKVPGSLS